MEEFEASGAEVIIGDITSAQDVSAAYNSFDTVVSTVGRNVLNTQVEMIELADGQPDVKRFLPNEYGTDVEYGPASKGERPHQQKLRVRQAMSRVGDLEFTYAVTGPYSALCLGAAGPGLEAAGSFDVQGRKAVLLGDREGRVNFTSMNDVRRLTGAAL